MTINDFREKAKKGVEHFSDTLKKVRTGRAAPSLIENISVDAYGSKMPLFQVATINAPEPRVLTISLWDISLRDAVLDALKNADLGINPVVDTTLIRLNLPAMTEERRIELTKVVGKYAEEAKVVMRNLRHEFLADLKKREKDEKLPEDMVRKEEEEIDKEIKKVNEEIDIVAKNKQKELMEI